jgi:hypothetical protein
MENVDFVTSGAARTAKWRASIKKRQLPETDDLDTAIASAFASFIAVFEQAPGLENQQAAEGMRRQIVKALTRAGYCGDETEVRASNRLYYLQMVARHPDASAADKRRWELGPPPEDVVDPADMPDDDDDQSWQYDEQDEGGYDD